VPVEEADGLPYTCVGLIHPRYTRGATGTDGKAVGANWLPAFPTESSLTLHHPLTKFPLRSAKRF